MDDETKQRIFQQVMDIWVKPEIERREKSGKIQRGFVITKIQIVFSLTSTKPQIRFNDEVKATAKCKINKAKKQGETVYDTDIEDIEKIELTDKDPNCAHITLLLFKNNWIVSFNFIYNQELIKNHIEASKEFYESARENLESKRLRPFFENAFASVELSAKSVLLALPDRKILTGRNHQDRLNKFKNWAELGNVKIEFSDTLSKLSSLRDSARYLYSDDYKKENPQEILRIIKEMLDFADESIK